MMDEASDALFWLLVFPAVAYPIGYFTVSAIAGAVRNRRSARRQTRNGKAKERETGT